jgi:hypothetical protein
MIDMPVAGFIFSFPRAAYPLGHKWECRQGARRREDWLVPKLQLGNQRILNLIAVMQCLGTRKKCVGL